MRVTVIPSDRFVAVDGTGYFIGVQADPRIRAIQWDGKAGTIETKSGAEPFDDFAVVAPFVAAWQAERDRIAALPPPPPPPPATPPRDLAAELDAIKADVARAAAAEAVLIEKGAVTAAEIDAKVPKTAAPIAEAAEAAKP